jgi:hypothetical protein
MENATQTRHDTTACRQMLVGMGEDSILERKAYWMRLIVFRREPNVKEKDPGVQGNDCDRRQGPQSSWIDPEWNTKLSTAY